MCGVSTLRVTWEGSTGSSFPFFGCGAIPSGDNDYYLEYNPANQLWCTGFNGVVQGCVHGNTIQFHSATHLVAHGETTHYSTAEPVVMGNLGASNAIWITNIAYKLPQPNPGQWAAVQQLGASYGPCNAAAPCPYGWAQGTAATVLYTYNYTK